MPEIEDCFYGEISADDCSLQEIEDLIARANQYYDKLENLPEPLLSDAKFGPNTVFPTVQIGNLPESLAFFQGGMGSGISNGPMAAAVAREGGFGTVTGVQFGLDPEGNTASFAKEIEYARANAEGGVIGVNIMRALNDYKALVQQAIESGAQFIVVGSGLPLDLAKLTQASPEAALLPIVSSGRALKLILKSWIKDGRLPDAIVYEHPGQAGGHLGSKIGETSDSKFLYRYGLADVFQTLRNFADNLKNNFTDEQKQAIYNLPVIAAGGIADWQDACYVMNLTNQHEQRVAGIQIGTPFLTTNEAVITHAATQADLTANQKFTDLHLRGGRIGITESTAKGLPGRVLLNEFVEEKMRRLREIGKLRREARKNCQNCIDPRACNFDQTQWCIMQRLDLARKGNQKAGLIFTGRRPRHADRKVSVADVMARFTQR